MISVCLASYNGEKYILQQINSILSQIGPTDELIISDDNSTDRTVEIIKQIGDDRIRLFENKDNGGYVVNFSRALSYSKGDFIFLSDQDDVWLPDRVSSVLPLLEEDRLVICDGYFTDENLNKTSKISDFRRYSKGFLRNIYKNIFWGTSFAFNKNIKDYCMPIPPKVKGHDGWIGFMCELKFEVFYLDKPLILYRRHGDAISQKLPFHKQLYSRLLFLYYSLKRYLFN